MSRATKVYFIASIDRTTVKIGHTRNLDRRLAAFRHASPLQLEVLACVPGTPDDERAIHAKFAAHHRHGEWFNGHREIIEFAVSIAASGELPADVSGAPRQRNPLRNHKRGYKRPIEHCRNVSKGLLASQERYWAGVEARAREQYIISGKMGHA